MYQQPQKTSRPAVSSAIRPAGDSDDYSDDDDEFEMSSSIVATKRNQFTQPSTSATTSAPQAVESNLSNGHGLSNGNGPTPKNEENDNNGNEQDDDDWGAATATPPVVRVAHSPPTPRKMSPSEEARVACTKGELERLKANFENVDVNAYFSDNYSPLITAAAHCKTEIIKFLLENGANVKIASRDSRTTSLMAAVTTTDKISAEEILECVKILVEAGIPVNAQDKNGLSALQMAIKRGPQGRRQIAEYLLDHGADPNQIDFINGRSALLYAAEGGDGRSCRLLMEKGADIHLVDDAGWTAFDLANDKGFNRLGDLIHQALKSKWRPGMNPNLMQEIDEQSIAKMKNNSLAAEGVTVREDSQIEMLLASMNAEKYLENFRKHRVTYVQFLQFVEDDFKAIGIEEVGIRKKLLDAVREVHNTDFEKSSLKMVPVNKKVTAAEAVCMVNNIKNHMQHVVSTMIFMHKRVSKDRQSMQLGIERNKIQDVVRLCQEVCDGNQQVEMEVLRFQNLMQSMEPNPQFKRGDEFLPRRRTAVAKSAKAINGRPGPKVRHPLAPMFNYNPNANRRPTQPGPVVEEIDEEEALRVQQYAKTLLVAFGVSIIVFRCIRHFTQ